MLGVLLGLFFCGGPARAMDPPGAPRKQSPTQRMRPPSPARRGVTFGKAEVREYEIHSPPKAVSTSPTASRPLKK